MTTKFKKAATVTTAALALATLFSAGTLTAFAATDTTDSTTTSTTATYSYLTGQQKNSDRHAQYEVISTFTTDAEREAYFEANDIGGDGPYSDAQHLDAEALVAAGVIDQATADKIAAYGSTKHDNIHARYESMTEMTADQRHAAYESAEADGFDGDSVSELLNAGIITQAQADAINSYLGK